MIRREDYVGKKVIHNGKVSVIEDISVVLNLPPGKDVLFRLDGVLVSASECEWADPLDRPKEE